MFKFQAQPRNFQFRTPPSNIPTSRPSPKSHILFGRSFIHQILFQCHFMFYMFLARVDLSILSTLSVQFVQCQSQLVLLKCRKVLRRTYVSSLSPTMLNLKSSSLFLNLYLLSAPNLFDIFLNISLQQIFAILLSPLPLTLDYTNLN